MEGKWKEKKVNLSSAIIIGAVLALLGGVIGANWQNWFGGFLPYLGANVKSENIVDWSPLDEVYDKVASSYNGDISKESVIEGAKKGLVEALGDKYTVYMDKETSADFYDSLQGNVGSGIGVEIGDRENYVRVLRVLPDNPAKRAGILVGDIIYKVDGEEVYTLSSEEIVSKIRGETGTNVEVTVARDGKEKTFNMVREKINNLSAYLDYDGDTAIITLTRFDQTTGGLIQGFAKEISGKNINKIILDLRGNTGGYVSAAQDVLSYWLDNQKMLIQKSKHFGTSTVSTAPGKAIFKDIKTIVLVDKSTASAAEIMVGALKDYNKVTVVGEKTYGKGVVQNLYTLSGGTTLKVTTAEWYTPFEKSINGEGIEPDIVIERTYEDINAMRDPQMDKAKEL